MFKSVVASDGSEPVKQSHKLLLGFGWPIILLTTALAARIVWEETVLTIEQGPQMVGFSLAHSVGALLLFAPFILLPWLVVAVAILATSIRRKSYISRWFWSSVALAILATAAVFTPSEFFQWLFIGSFAKSPYAAELMTYAAAEGNVRTVQGYLDHGVPIESRNREGSTAAYTAAVGGSVPTLALLSSRGADLNATNSYGDSPLEAAIGMQRNEAVSFLQAHGAIQIQGTKEQREGANKAIVRRDTERQNQLH